MARFTADEADALAALLTAHAAELRESYAKTAKNPR
jgi:hypothetical protein